MTPGSITAGIHGKDSTGNHGDGGNGSKKAPLTTSSGLPIERSVLGVIFFIASEIMFFSGLVSVFLILKAGNHAWPPTNQPNLPVEVTAINTIFLLLSAYTMYRAWMAINISDSGVHKSWLAITTILGMIFLAIQGYEWIRLVSFGLTFTSSIYGGTFYALIGCHGLHVFGAMIGMVVVLTKSLAGKYTKENHTGIKLQSVYWFFVVGIWPILYLLVYFN